MNTRWVQLPALNVSFSFTLITFVLFFPHLLLFPFFWGILNKMAEPVVEAVTKIWFSITVVDQIRWALTWSVIMISCDRHTFHPCPLYSPRLLPNLEEPLIIEGPAGRLETYTQKHKCTFTSAPHLHILLLPFSVTQSSSSLQIISSDFSEHTDEQGDKFVTFRTTKPATICSISPNIQPHITLHWSLQLAEHAPWYPWPWQRTVLSKRSPPTEFIYLHLVFLNSLPASSS